MVDFEQTGYADLSSDQVERLRKLEEQLGDDVYVIAYEQQPQPARLADDELDTLREAERDLPGVVLVAYRKP